MSFGGNLDIYAHNCLKRFQNPCAHLARLPFHSILKDLRLKWLLQILLKSFFNKIFPLQRF